MFTAVRIKAPYPEPALQIAAINMVDAQLADVAEQAPNIDAIVFLHAGLQLSVVVGVRVALIEIEQRAEGAVEVRQRALALA